MKNSDLVFELMERCGVKFGTSGARGRVIDMTDYVCYSYVTGFLQYLVETGDFFAGKQVALAGDLRPSTPRILAACATAITDMGGDPVFCGYVPTPALALYAFGLGIPSLMVTGSHIPDDRNGIKFYRAEGEVLKTDEVGITRQVLSVDPDLFDYAETLLRPAKLQDPVDVVTNYLARYVDYFGADALQGMRIGVYQHSAVGRYILFDLVSALGAEALPLGLSDRFIPVDTEAIRPEDTELALKWAAEHKLDAIVSTDGDSDRPLIADHTGVWLRGDVLGAVCARILKADCVVTPVSSNTIVEKCGAFLQTIRTRIGSPYVIDAMAGATNSGFTRVCGYEANGGFFVANDLKDGGHDGMRTLRSLPTRDAVLPMITILAAAKASVVSGKVNALMADLPLRVTHSNRIPEFPIAHSNALLAYFLEGSFRDQIARANELFVEVFGPVSQIDTTDGFRISFDNGDIIHLRPSGNAPELRCYSESTNADNASRINAAALDAILASAPWQ